MPFVRSKDAGSKHTASPHIYFFASHNSHSGGKTIVMTRLAHLEYINR